MTTAAIITAIVTGELDRDLERINLAIESRREDRTRRLRPGDVVELYGLRPEHHNGRRATIVDVKRTRFHVRVDGVGHHPAHTVVVPMRCVRPVSE